VRARWDIFAQEEWQVGDFDTFLVFAARYDDQADAQADYDAVKALYYEADLIDTFDAAVVTRREDGKVKIVSKHEQPTRTGGWRGAGIGLATGAVIALFPAAAIGSGLLAATTAAGAGLGALAGHVAGGMSRTDLKELGELLDAGETGLIVIAASDMSTKVDRAIARAENVVSRQMQADEDALEDEIAAAEREGGTAE
jgi:uncharacterized membrane protein